MFNGCLIPSRIIIGAPKGTYPGGLPLDDPGAPRSNETGLVYMCPVEPGECEGVRGNLSLYSSDLSNDRDNPEGRLFDHFREYASTNLCSRSPGRRK